tara:strand:- start:306 stop:689 length:384 start_codon:yes stop_codon:yes gene_type:complete
MPDRTGKSQILSKGLEDSLMKVAKLREKVKTKEASPRTELAEYKPLPAESPQRISRRDLAGALVELDIIWPPRDISNEQQGMARAKVWHKALQNLTPAELRMGVEKCVRSPREFPPTPGVILSLAKL